MLIIANGLEGFLRNELQRLTDNNHVLRAIALNKKVPQAVCLNIGFKESCGEFVIVTGSYQQITEKSFSRMLDALDANTDIITPWRRNRVDPRINQLQSNLYNLVVRKVAGTDLHDLSCTVKVMRREVLEQTELYGNLYRFMPILAGHKGFRYKEIDCEHYQEHGKIGFFGFSLYFNRLIDILTLYFNTHFSRKPLRFFSSYGAVFMGLGLIGFAYIILQKLLLDVPIGGRAVLLLSILLLVIGVQCATVGLLGEIIAFTHGRHRKEYTIEKII
jgi:hypothetical protein